MLWSLPAGIIQTCLAGIEKKTWGFSYKGKKGGEDNYIQERTEKLYAIWLGACVTDSSLFTMGELLTVSVYVCICGWPGGIIIIVLLLGWTAKSSPSSTCCLLTIHTIHIQSVSFPNFRDYDDEEQRAAQVVSPQE